MVLDTNLIGEGLEWTGWGTSVAFGAFRTLIFNLFEWHGLSGIVYRSARFPVI